MGASNITSLLRENANHAIIPVAQAAQILGLQIVALVPTHNLRILEYAMTPVKLMNTLIPLLYHVNHAILHVKLAQVQLIINALLVQMIAFSLKASVSQNAQVTPSNTVMNQPVELVIVLA